MTRNRFSRSIGLASLVLAVILGLLSTTSVDSSRVIAQEAPASAQWDPLATPEFQSLLKEYKSGTNALIATVDGTPITIEGIRDEYPIQDLVNSFLKASPNAPREHAELAAILEHARDKAEEIILLNEAKAAQLTEVESYVVDTIENEKRKVGIGRDDFEAWAAYCLKEHGKTPLEYRTTIREYFQRNLALRAMAGVQGAIRGIKLPVFYPLEVSPAEVFREYKRNVDAWKQQKDIDLTLIGIRRPTFTGRGAVERVNILLDDAKERLVQNESLDSVESYLKLALKQLRADINKEVGSESETAKGIRIDIRKNLSYKDDEEMPQQFRSLTRGVSEGGYSEVDSRVESKDDVEEDLVFFLIVNAYSEGKSRAFFDPVVQLDAKEAVRSRKLQRNLLRVKRLLRERAVIHPRAILFGR